MKATQQKKRRNGQLRAIDLFCGCGGLTLGLKQAGFEVVGAVDIEQLSVETYRANHPEVALWEADIRELRVSSVKRKVKLRKGRLDLLAGCPPCQGFSTMRTLNGSLVIDDPRNDLLFEFLRFVEGLRPRAVMLENVPGLARDGRFMAFRQRMREMGYVDEHRILDASDYGVAQRRRRLIYLAGLGEAIPFASATQHRKTVKDAIGNLPRAGQSGDPAHDLGERRTRGVMALIKLIPKNGGSRTDLPKRMQLACHKRCNGFKDVYGRMAWDDPGPTITSGCFNPSKGRFLHPDEDRAMTMREAALLQGFPGWYKFPCTDNKAGVAWMIGNALPPPFITAHARSICKTLGAKEHSQALA